jgi:glycerol kinase
MSNRQLILAIDQGTTNTKAVLVDAEGVVIARGAQPVPVRFPKPAWVEQDARAIWDSVRCAIDACLAAAPGAIPDAIAISNQRESVALWDRATGTPEGPVIVWQCRRTAEFVEGLRQRGLAGEIARITGLGLDPLFSGSKIRWLIDHALDGVARAARGALCAGTMDSWVLWNLTGGAAHACDVSNASRTQLFDIHQLDWSDDLLSHYGVPRAVLPNPRPSRAQFGVSVACGRLPAGIPVLSLIGDSHGALFGQGAFQPGVVKATYGTGSSLMTPIPKPVLSTRGVSTTVAWGLEAGRATYALEGNITVTGSAVRWAADMLGLPNADAVAELAATVTDTDGLYLVPAFAGLGAPYWNSAARGLITGMTFSSGRAQLARAAVDAIAYQVKDVFDAMAAGAGNLSSLLADGGASKNDALMQFQADILGRPVLRAASPDASALGAAYLAGLESGLWRDLDALAALPRPRDRFEPAMPADQVNARVAGWRRAVERTLAGAEPIQQ